MTPEVHAPKKTHSLKLMVMIFLCVYFNIKKEMVIH